MTNFETGEKLLREAEEYLEEMHRAYGRGSWNVVIRRSQEVVELSLKALLKIMGIEYPKVHDTAEFFITVTENRGIALEEETKEKIKKISTELAAKRAPAFYLEKEFTGKEAEEAKEGAEYVLNVAKDLYMKLK